MKKFLPIILSALIAVSASVCAGAATDTSLYRSKAQAVYNASPYKTYSHDYGFLYDVDGNGVRELITYSSKSGDMAPSTVVNVFTIKGKKVKTLVKNKELFLEVGGPHGFVGIAKKGKTKYVICQGDTGSTSGAPGETVNRYGTITLYKIKGAKIAKKIKASYNIKFTNGFAKPKVTKCKAKVDGKKMSYKKFKKWFRSFKVSKVKKTKSGLFGVTYSCNSTKLSSLLYSL